MKQNIDLLTECNKEGIKTVAFKAETDPSVATENAKKLLERKGVQAVCLNIIDESNPFGSDTNRIDFITPSTTISLPKSDKLSLSLHLLEQAESL
jgi:phosphopantothenoylcysteine decarboxylase/phosphopantothenate--cysteine ligase